MKTILDTNVVSELRKAHPEPAVVERLRALGSRHLYLTSITLAELAHGVHRLDDGRKKTGLLTWLGGIEQRYKGCVLPFDHDAAMLWGQCMANARKQGQAVSREDSQIAAIALRFDLPVMSRDVQPFLAMGVSVANPWQPDA